MYEKNLELSFLEIYEQIKQNDACNSADVEPYVEPYNADAEYVLSLIDEYCRTIDSVSNEQSALLVAGC